MNLNTVKNFVTSKAGRQVLKLRKHSPTILFGVGAVGVVGTVVLASKATLRLEGILLESEIQMRRVREADLPTYTDENKTRDLLVLRTRAVGSLVKLYAPAAALGVVSIAALTGAHVMLNRRNVAMTAAYVAIDKGFKEYRARVADKYGVDTDKELRYGVKQHTIVEETETGPVTKKIKKADFDKMPSGYARFFEKGASQSWSPHPHYNQLFIQCQQNYANDLLKSRGHVFLNEVYDMLGLERTSAGQIVGWVLGNGDDFVDFGVFDGKNAHMGVQFVNGNEKSILLDFNVDGAVFELI